MPGLKQHFIPQIFLRGFEASRPGKHVQVLVYRSGRKPYLSSVEGVATKRYFYSDKFEDDVKTLDDAITCYENHFKHLLRRLRALNGPVDANLAAEVVTHLTVRSAFLRDVFGHGAQELLTGMCTLFAQEEWVRSHFGIDQEAPSSIFITEVDKVIQKFRSYVSPNLPLALLRRLVFVLLREGFSEIHLRQLPGIEDTFDEIAEAMPILLRNGHTRALEGGLVPAKRFDALAELNWMVLPANGVNLILPDCIALSFNLTGTYEPYLLYSDNPLEQILLPLSKDRLLVGQRNAEQPVFIDRFNQSAAACSLEFFISSEATSELTILASVIGSYPKTTVMSIAREALDRLGNPTDQADSPAASEPIITKPVEGESDAALPSTYVVSFLDCADQNTAEHVAAIVRTVVNELAQEIPLRRLESITFAHDYIAALHNVDRGIPNVESLRPTEEDYATGVAMAPIVLRDGQIRCCIVMRSWVSSALQDGKDQKAFETALHMLVVMLARVGFVEIVDSTLPGFLLKPITDQWNALFFRYVDGVCSAYFSARVAAMVSPDAGSGYCDLFLAAFEHANEIVPKARLAYGMDGDLNAFLAIAMKAVSTVLVHGATLLGHFDELERSLSNDAGRVISVLDDRGLTLWLDVYRRDLNNLYNRLGKWSSHSELMTLNVHVERLLWLYGIFLWKTDGGEIRVEIPTAWDPMALMNMGREQNGTKD